MEDSSSQQTRNLVVPLNMPVAIIVAGALIAAAIFFGGGIDSGSNLAANNGNNTGTGAVSRQGRRLTHSQELVITCQLMRT